MDTQDFTDPLAPAAKLHCLTNGRFEVLISDTGAGGASWTWIALTRLRKDPVQDDLGSVLYLRDLETGVFRSLGYQPTRSPADRYSAGSADGSFRLTREDDGIGADLEVSVDPEADLERRRVRLTNGSGRPRRMEMTSYLEPVLFPAASDEAHPAFAKLFVQTERDESSGALLARRRPRAANETWPWLVHALIDPLGGPQEWETDRMAFLGRGRTLANPRALTDRVPLIGTLGNVLDPCLALRTVVELAPGETAELCFLTGAAPDRADALALATAEPGFRPAVDGSRPKAASPVPAGALGKTSGEGLRHFNGYGGFSADGREYVIRLPWEGDSLGRPPLPWINVIANPRAGCLVGESGAGYAWARNSQANRLTPWLNDPATDPYGEALYLRDESDGAVWSPLPGPIPAPADYEVRHGLGYSRFRCAHGGLVQETTVFVPPEDPLRLLCLRLTNESAESRDLTVVGYQRLVMASQPLSESPVVTAYDPDLGLLRAENPAAGDFAGAIAFAWVDAEGAGIEDRTFSGDRLAFLGRHRDPTCPVALEPGARLDGRVGAGLDPCFAQQIRIALAPGATAVLTFALGEALDEAELAELSRRYRSPGAVDSALESARAFWIDLTSAVQVQTPEPAIDLMLNGWLLYQTLGCRIWARSAFYQSGGAVGYRDQLQDAAAFAPIRPALTRDQILLHAAHQFIEGDVLHWWHPEPLARGLRTRFSDDLLWLPYVVAHYVRTTGEGAILDVQVPYLVADPLAPDQDEAYLLPQPSGESGDLYDHCCRAIDRSLTRGSHGLPLMGTGDWNDGMNRVGREGRGESVWMGFFLHRILSDFLPLCDGRRDEARAARYRAWVGDLEIALEQGGWDGAWYRRAYYDDGTPLGSGRAPDADPECRIDALAQSWAAISGAVPRERAEQALDALETHLVSEADGLIRLLTPPFQDTPKDPGYIKGYVAGVRENGGQYTHAACWTVMAMAALGRRERAARLLAMLSPVSHSASPEAVARYRLEPYTVAADIYGEPPHVGRGGWSWYTGSAGWWYRVALESVLGVTLEGGRTLVVRPCVPAAWPGFRVDYRIPSGLSDGEIRCRIRVDNGPGSGAVVAVRLDGVELPVQDGAARIELPLRAGDYRIHIELG